MNRAAAGLWRIRNVQEAIIRELLGDRKFLELNLRYAQADVGSDLGLFYRKLGLTADQIAHFESILADSLSEVWRLRVDALREGKERATVASSVLWVFGADGTVGQELVDVAPAESVVLPDTKRRELSALDQPVHRHVRYPHRVRHLRHR